MIFCEAMVLLKSGKKVTRQSWIGAVYFCMDGTDVKSYQVKLSPYIYNEDIMVSDGWLVNDDPTEYSFCDIVYLLQSGGRAKLKGWKETFIYCDPAHKELIIRSMESFPFIPDFSSFVAQDWVEIS